MNGRSSGILLHISALPSPYGIGDFGPGAYAFADLLASAHQSWWQVLPLTFTHSSQGNSPYSAMSAFAGDTLFISPEKLFEEGLLTRTDLALQALPAGRVDFKRAIKLKMPLFEKAFKRFNARKAPAAFTKFCAVNRWWLDDFTLFLALRAERRGTLWNTWESVLRDRKPAALALARRKYAHAIQRESFLQYIFFKQWSELRRYAGDRGVRFIGDIPIYISLDSCDVWKNRELFELSRTGEPVAVAGVPPDYFCRDGQLWGNPVFDWKRQKQDKYAWWMKRLAHHFEQFDTVRIDHFRGFAQFWRVPSPARTARGGSWAPGPGRAIFDVALKRFGRLPVIAEDLGVITPDVTALMERYNLPGMKILQFAFGDDFPNGAYLPHRYPSNCVAYTGTHDNNTVRGWFEHDLTAAGRAKFARYAGEKVSARSVHRVLLRELFESQADTVIVPLADVLGLGAAARINTPGTAKGNWRWRVTANNLSSPAFQYLAALTERSYRRYV